MRLPFALLLAAVLPACVDIQCFCCNEWGCCPDGYCQPMGG